MPSSHKPCFNTRPESDPCEAVVALSIGQSLTPRGRIDVKHYNEKCYTDVRSHHVSAEGAEELRAKLHKLVDDYIGYYYDFTNGV